jgi:Methylase involved in ubiquinone/menaquinone biosynthesis
MKVREHFDEKANSYYEHIYLSGKINYHVHNQQVRRRYFRDLILDHEDMQGGIALDIGSGPGSIAIELLGYGLVTFCIDISFNMLLNNRKNNGKVVKLAQCSADSLCYKENSFDVITAAGVLEYVQDDKKALREILRVLKPGGTLIISVPIKSLVSSYMRKQLRKLLFNREVNQFYHKSYTPNGFLREMKEAGFVLKNRISHHFVFFPIDYLFPKLSIQFDYFITRLLRKSYLFARFGKTFIIRAIKPDKIA